jgi:prepilin-type N-terminal cleavage/methylation domain-containing protein
MNARCQKIVRGVKNREGFTLIEMLIVIIILGILAMVIIPQITVSQDDAKVSTLKTNLGGIRSAIEVYYTQHNNVYPGLVKETDGTTATASAGEATTAMTAQLQQFSDTTGKVSATKTGAFILGPYIKDNKLPDNPFKDNVVLSDLAVVDITAARTTDGTTGWKYLPKLGVFFANDGLASGGTNHSVY